MTFPTETPRWRRYLRFWRRDVQADIDDELAFHLQTRIEELAGRGLTSDAARAQALEEFGDVRAVRGDLRAIDQRMAKRADRLAWVDAWRQDLVYSVRSLRRTPGVTVTVIVMLALGLGANAAMFTLLNAVFLRPPAGVRQPAPVRRLWTEIPFRSGTQFWSGYDYAQYQGVRDALAGIATTTTYRPPDEVKVGRGAAATRAMMSLAASDFFALLGVRPAIGRFYSPDEDRLGNGAHVAVASYAYWRRALDADSAVIGETIRIAGVPYTLVGVADRNFTGVDLNAADLWVPLATTPNFRGSPWWLEPAVNGFQILIRPRPGVPDVLIEARAGSTLRRPDLRRLSGATSITRVGSIIAARGPGKRLQEVEIATRLGGVALVVLVIACANVVSLLLARAVRRRREIAMRLALGVSRARLTRLILTESVLLAGVAGVTALLAAVWGGVALRTLLLPDVHWAQSPVDWRVLVGAVLATLAAGVVAGIIPAVQSGSTELTDVLKAGARGCHVRRSALGSLLVIAQVGLSVVLLLGAALFVRSLSNVRGLDLGFDASRLVYGRVRFDLPDAPRDSLEPARLAHVAEQLRGTPGVESVALSSMRLMYGFSFARYFPAADTLSHRKPMGMFWAVSPGYFATTGTRIVAGADFPNASGSSTPPSVIVNRAMADALWPGENPLGRCVRFETAQARCNAVTGVVETARYGQVIEESTPQFYLPLDNMPFERGPATIAVRAEPAMASSVVRTMRRALIAAFPGGDPVIDRMSTVLEADYRPWRLGATLFSLFGILAGVVAALGIYSTVSYGVSQRTHEFGVRVALGAQVADVIRHVLGSGLRTVLVGIAAGVILSLAAGRLVAALLYGVSPRDPFALTSVVVTLLLTASVAAVIPAWRASRVDPVVALHHE